MLPASIIGIRLIKAQNIRNNLCFNYNITYFSIKVENFIQYEYYDDWLYA